MFEKTLESSQYEDRPENADELLGRARALFKENPVEVYETAANIKDAHPDVDLSQYELWHALIGSSLLPGTLVGFDLPSEAGWQIQDYFPEIKGNKK